jgi:DNA (cytosine-5)-methyltransferase 1
MNELALFAGAGGGILGGKLLGWNTIGAVEIEEYPRKVLLKRQQEGILNKFPIWDDIKTFDGRPWEGAVDIISGGFPCTDISAAGKGAGIEGKKSGLWKEMARVVREVRSRFVFVENSPMLTSRGLHRVLGDLAEMGYDARWCVLGADDAGAPHRRKRIWILGYTNKSSCRQRSPEQSKREYTNKPNKITWWDIDPAEIPNSNGLRFESRSGNSGSEIEKKPDREDFERCDRSEGFKFKSFVGRVAHGVASNVDKLEGIVYNNTYEREQLSEASPEKNEECQEMSELRRERETITGPPQEQKPRGQLGREPGETLPEMPQRSSREGWRLGAWENSIRSGELQDMREIVHTDSLSRNQKEFLVWFGAMHGGKWIHECLEAMGKTPRVSIGVKNRVNRIKAIGNGQVPAVAAIAFIILSEGVI